MTSRPFVTSQQKTEVVLYFWDATGGVFAVGKKWCVRYYTSKTWTSAILLTSDLWTTLYTRREADAVVVVGREVRGKSCMLSPAHNSGRVCTEHSRGSVWICEFSLLIQCLGITLRYFCIHFPFIMLCTIWQIRAKSFRCEVVQTFISNESRSSCFEECSGCARR